MTNTNGSESIAEGGDDERPSLPVTILSGFLGSGKTTLLCHILHSTNHQLKIAVIVNDMAELNIDAELVAQADHSSSSSDGRVVQAQREVIRMSNGCICCTLRGDLIREIARIRESSEEFDYILIESTGIAEPEQVAQSFVFDPETEQLAENDDQMLWKRAHLDTCVTVVDAHSFLAQTSTLERFSDKYDDGLDTTTPEGLEEGKKPIANLLVEQVEFANVIILNKMDLVQESPDELQKTKDLIRTLNPAAKLIETEYCKVDITENIINTGMFDITKASTSPGWIQEIRKIQKDAKNGVQVLKSSAGEADEYGVTSFVYRARTPFDEDRFGRFLTSYVYFDKEWANLDSKEKRRQFHETDPRYKNMIEKFGNIFRVKGFIWMAHHDNYIIGFAQSGRLIQMGHVMPWYAVIPKDQWGIDPKSQDYKVIVSKFEEPHGDRRQELVFIGTNLKVEKIRAALDKCLLTKKELKRYKFYSNSAIEQVPIPVSGEKKSEAASSAEAKAVEKKSRDKLKAMVLKKLKDEKRSDAEKEMLLDMLKEIEEDEAKE